MSVLSRFRRAAFAALGALLVGCVQGGHRLDDETAAYVMAHVGPVQVRGVSARSGREAIHAAICARAAPCEVYQLRPDGTGHLILSDEGRDYRWVDEEPDGALLAVSRLPRADYMPRTQSRVVRCRDCAGNPELVEIWDGEITSLQALGAGSYAILVSESRSPLAGCVSGCRYVPDSLRLVVIDPSGSIVGAQGDIVGGMSGESFLPLTDSEWLVLFWDAKRTRRSGAIISGGGTPRLRVYNDASQLAKALHSYGGQRATRDSRDMGGSDGLFAPFEVLVPSSAIDLSGPAAATSVMPVSPGAPSTLQIVRRVRAGEGAWQTSREWLFQAGR